MSNSHLSPIVQQALQASTAGDTAAALRLLEAAVAEKPDDAVPHYLMAAEFAQSGQMEQAEAAFARAVLLAPGFEIARFQLGLLQFTSGRAAVALVSWQPLFELPETHPLRHFVTGLAALAGDRFDEANQHLRQGMALNHDNPPLNGDMQKVLDRIEPLLAANAAPADTPAAPEESSHHVLLSNYQQDGPPH